MMFTQTNQTQISQPINDLYEFTAHNSFGISLKEAYQDNFTPPPLPAPTHNKLTHQ